MSIEIVINMSYSICLKVDCIFCIFQLPSQLQVNYGKAYVAFIFFKQE